MFDSLRHGSTVQRVFPAEPYVQSCSHQLQPDNGFIVLEASVKPLVQTLDWIVNYDFPLDSELKPVRERHVPTLLSDIMSSLD